MKIISNKRYDEILEEIGELRTTNYNKSRKLEQKNNEIHCLRLRIITLEKEIHSLNGKLGGLTKHRNKLKKVLDGKENNNAA